MKGSVSFPRLAFLEFGEKRLSNIDGVSGHCVVVVVLFGDKSAQYQSRKQPYPHSIVAQHRLNQSPLNLGLNHLAQAHGFTFLFGGDMAFSMSRFARLSARPLNSPSSPNTTVS